MTEIKICGLSRVQDIDYVNEAGPDYAGFILGFPRSRRNITTPQAKELISRLSPGIKAVGVFVDMALEAVAEAARDLHLDVIQLHGSEDGIYVAALRETTGLAVWKAFKIRSREDLGAALRSSADEILLDSGCGTGEAFDWALAGAFERPFILAGGLTPENIPSAIRSIGPKAVDISSGVETDGAKDRQKILAAVKAAHTAPDSEL